MSKTKELRKKRYGTGKRIVPSVLEAVSHVIERLSFQRAAFSAIHAGISTRE